MKFKHTRVKPEGAAAFKTLLKRSGFKVGRRFYGFDCNIAEFKGRLYRFRFRTDEVDISCPIVDFDRWANSVDYISSIEEFKVSISRRLK